MSTYTVKPSMLKHGITSWNTVSSGGYYWYGTGSEGAQVAIMSFAIPSSVSNISQIVLNLYSYSASSGTYYTQAKLNTTTPGSSTTPSQWLSHTALSTSTTYASTGNYNAAGSMTNISYAFSSGLSSITGGSTVYVWVYGSPSSTAGSLSRGLYNSNYPSITITYGTTTTTKYTVSAVAKDNVSSATVSASSVTSGTSVKFTATVNSGATFDGWYSNSACTTLVSTSNPYTKTITSNTTLYAKASVATTTAVKPTITRSTQAYGFSSTIQQYVFKSSTAGYVYTKLAGESSWTKMTSSKTTSITVSIPSDSSTTSLYKTYYGTVLTNYSDSTYSGTVSSSYYTTFYVPRFAFSAYVNSEDKIEINSYEYSTPKPTSAPSGFTFQGWAGNSSSTTASYDGSSWSSSYNGYIRYAIFSKPQTTIASITLNANGGSCSYSTAKIIQTATTIYGTGSVSGGNTRNDPTTDVIPTRDGYSFKGWGTSSSATTVAYTSTLTALSNGYTGTLYAIWEQSSRGVRIFTSSTSSALYEPYIYNGSSWVKYIPYVYSGGWSETG